MTEDILFVPSAILVPNELKFDLGPLPTGMIPLDGRAALEHIADRYAEYELVRYVAGDEQIERLDAYLPHSPRDWRLIEVSETASLGETVTRSLQFIANEQPLADVDLYVNFADTIVSPVGHDIDCDTISCARVDHAYRWTSFASDEEGRIESVTEKFTTVFDNPRKVFTGQFKLTAPDEFLTRLVETAETADETDPFYVALEAYLDGREYELLETETWQDIGHLDTYYQNKRDSLNVREFNDVNVTTNTIRKSSENVKTIRNEIEWYQKLPRQLQPYIPQVYNYSKTRDDPYVRMEYVGYPTLSDIYIYGSHGLHLWSNVYDALFELLDRFAEYRLETGRADIEETLYRMYYQKTVDRLERARDVPGLDLFFDETEVVVNGNSYRAVDPILADLEDVLARSSLLERDSLNVIHGDLCFPNILFDVRNNVPKLIDPRGEFGSRTIHGDPRYDLAKLRHSVSGHYEFIINDMFEISINPDGRTVSYETYSDEVHDRREALFDEQLEKRYRHGIADVALLESLLFLSMVPLHNDSVDRQQCMLATGIEKFAGARREL